MKVTVQEIRQILAGQLKVRLTGLPSILIEEGTKMEMNITELTAEQVKQFAPGLYKQIQEAGDPDQAILDLQGRVDELETGNKELKEKNEAQDQRIKDLEKENKDLQLKVDENDAKEKLGQKQEMIDKLIEEAELPKEAVTDVFRKHLESLDEEDDIKSAIEDRKSVADRSTSQVHGSGDEFKEEGDSGEKGKKKEPTDKDRKSVREAFVARTVVKEVAD